MTVMIRNCRRNLASSSRLLHKHKLSPTLQQLVKSPVEDAHVVAQGHVRSCRSMKNMSFVDIADGASNTTINVVFPGPESLLKYQLKVGQSIEINGQWKYLETKQAVEIVCDPIQETSHGVKILGDVPNRYPIQKKKTSLEFLRTLPTLRHRSNTLGQVLRTRSEVEGHLHDFFRSQEFVKVSPPEISSSDCEGAGELFFIGSSSKKNFFKKNVYLTVSTQLHLEVLAAALNRVWTLTPCFRAEDSDTNRHLSEFWMLEAEVNYVDEVQQMTGFCESMLRFVAEQLKKEEDYLVSSNNAGNSSSLSLQDEFLEKIQERLKVFTSEAPWPVIQYQEALAILNKNNPNVSETLQFGDEITTEYEKWLAGEYFKGPVFVTDYPKEQKPFYMRKSTNYNPETPTVACFDLIVPEIGELIGGSLRIHDYTELIEELETRKMDKKALDWYISLRENGTVPHGGFGMGFERLIMYFTGMHNIRDVIPFPRFPGNCKC